MSQRRNYLLLQGPHGPFFQQLGRMLRRTDASVWRVGFNAGDSAFWRDRSSYIPYTGSVETWDMFLTALIERRQITDLVLYGDTRPIHAIAIKRANLLGLRVHIFEEGYLRPYWVTYERDGSNGNSRLMSLSLDDIKNMHRMPRIPIPASPATWGDMRQHIFYGALYHWFVLFLNSRYPRFQPHRDLTVRQEFMLHLRKLILMPATSARRLWATRRVKSGGFPYHLVLLQLEHDTSFQYHTPFETMGEFLKLVIQGFSQGARPHQHLVFKAHPLEDGRTPLRQNIHLLAKEYGVENRVHFLSGGKLAPLLDQAESAVTANSTAGQQVLWRGLPLLSLGKSVYSKPEFTSDQPVAEFFREPKVPDREAYLTYRQFLLETSQLPGGYYSAKGRRQVLRKVVDRMLSDKDPYEIAPLPNGVMQQQFSLIA